MASVYKDFSTVQTGTTLYTPAGGMKACVWICQLDAETSATVKFAGGTVISQAAGKSQRGGACWDVVGGIDESILIDCAVDTKVRLLIDDVI